VRSLGSNVAPPGQGTGAYVSAVMTMRFANFAQGT
jgi:hypothetical protein